MTSRAIPEIAQAQGLLEQYQRLLTGGLWLGLSVAAVGVVGATLWTRVHHITLTNSLINARLVRVRAPITGRFNAFYVQPGTEVKAGDILARLTPSPEQRQSLLDLQVEQQGTKTQLQTAKKVLQQLGQQLAQLSNTQTRLASTATTLSVGDVEAQAAQVDQIQARLTLARQTYQRYQELAVMGAVSQQMADEKKAELSEATALLARAVARLVQARKSLQATQRGSQPTTQEVTVLSQRTELQQAIQTQSSLVALLETKMQGYQQRLQQMQTTLIPQTDMAIRAPLTGVVYDSNRETSEQVTQQEPVLSVLDCQDIWVEGVMSAQQISQVDTKQPVLVQLPGSTQTVEGRVELTQSLSLSSNQTNQPNRNGAVTQVQALQPPIGQDLIGQPLVRLVVRVPQLQRLQQEQQFCGVGQLAQITLVRSQMGW